MLHYRRLQNVTRFKIAGENEWDSRYLNASATGMDKLVDSQAVLYSEMRKRIRSRQMDGLFV